MQHMAAFSFASTNSGAGAYVTITAVPDSYLTINSNNRFIAPPGANGMMQLKHIAGALAFGTTMLVARINNPTLRAIGLPSIPTVNPGLTIPSAINVPLDPDQGPELPIADEFGIEADATAIEQQTGFLWLHDGNVNVPKLPILSLQFTSTITPAANVWTLGTISLTQTLPVGKYLIVGMDLFGTTLLGARLVMPNGGPRPGVICRATQAILSQNQFRRGAFGSFGDFTSYALPQIEIFNSGTPGSTAFRGQLDVIKIG